MLIEVLQPDFVFEDDRGTMAQLVRKGFNQVNVITSKANSFRGGHYHQINREAFYVISGEIKLVLRKDDETETLKFSAGDMFAIRPLVSHDFFYITDTVLISMYDRGVELENGEKDIVKDVNTYGD